jgi:hypothetical protein
VFRLMFGGPKSSSFKRKLRRFAATVLRDESAALDEMAAQLEAERARGREALARFG